MREIKFRAWDNLSKKIVAFNGRKWCPKYGQHINIQYVTEKEDTILKLISKFFYGSDLELIYMQYTGLKDKNGRDIYEDDVIDYDGEIAKVTYENTMASFCVGGNSFNSSEAKYMKIIGNIYEDSHLLDNN